jgi:hypothetical protein
MQKRSWTTKEQKKNCLHFTNKWTHVKDLAQKNVTALMVWRKTHRETERERESRVKRQSM